MTPQNARKTRSFKIRKRRLAHSFPLTAFKINISITFMHYNISQVSNQHTGEGEEEEDLTHISKTEDKESLSDPLQDQRFRTGPNPQPPVDTSNILKPNNSRH
jgi:hypothetical protein